MSLGLSIIVPVYNCETWIIDKVKEFERLSQEINNCEVVFVDDGSRDGTVDVVNNYISDKDNIRLIRLTKNSGKGAAVMKGMSEVESELIIFTDCDLAYPITEVIKVYDKLIYDKEVDVVIANRRHSESTCELNPRDFKHVYSRERSGRILNKILKLTGLTVFDDTQAGLKGFRKTAVSRLFPITVYRFGFDIELLFIAMKKGLKVEQVHVRYIYHDAESTVGIIGDGLKILADAVRIIINNIDRKYE